MSPTQRALSLAFSLLLVGCTQLIDKGVTQPNSSSGSTNQSSGSGYGALSVWLAPTSTGVPPILVETSYGNGWVNAKSTTVPSCGSAATLTLTAPAGVVQVRAWDSRNPNTPAWQINVNVQQDHCTTVELQ